MTISPAVDATIAGLRARLAQSLSDGTLDLTDDLLGQPVLAPLLHNSALTVSAVDLDLSAPDAVTLHGVADLLGSAQVNLDLTFAMVDGELTGTLVLTADDHPLRLSALVYTVADGAGLPAEVPDLGLETVTVSITPHTGAFRFAGTCAVPWTLPFGGDGLPVDQVSITLERAGETDAPVQVTLELGSAAAYRVVEGVEVTAKDLRFQYGGTADWTVGGSLAADLFGSAIDLSAALTSTQERREFTFTAAAALSVDLSGAGTLTATGLSLSVARTPEAEYSWSVEADGSVDLLDGTIVVAGALSAGSAGLTLSPPTDGTAARVTVPLPGLPTVAVHIGVRSLHLSWAAGQSSAEAEAVVWFSGLPGEFGTALPGSEATAVTGTLAVTAGTEADVNFTVDPVLPKQDFHLPSLSAGDFHLDLSHAPAALEVGRLEVAWAHDGGLSIGADLGLGLPADLNQIFGTGHTCSSPTTTTPRTAWSSSASPPR